MSTPSEPRRPAATVPMFAAPPSQRLDDPLPTVPAATPTSTTTGTPQSPPQSPSEPSLRQRLNTALGRDVHLSELPKPDAPRSDGAPSPRTATSTEPRFKPGGDPQKVGETLAGLLLIVSGFVAVRMARRGRQFRRPTLKQAQDIAFPIGRIMTRHLPMDVFGEDVFDAAQSAAATQAYIEAGPLAPRVPLEHLDPQE